jgi:hypothetical protein
LRERPTTGNGERVAAAAVAGTGAAGGAPGTLIEERGLAAVVVMRRSSVKCGRCGGTGALIGLPPAYRHAQRNG